MLIMFKVKNYTSFEDEAILDMRATSYVQHPSHVIQVNDKLSLLKTTAIYGANASGKSNLISAMYFFKQYILSQFISASDKGISSEKTGNRMKLETFALSDHPEKSSEFDIIFLRGNKQIQYGFECTGKEVLCEWLYFDNKRVYDRNGSSIILGSKYEKSLGDYKKVPSERLYLSVLEYFLDDASRAAVLDDLISFLKNEFDVFSELLFESPIKGLGGLYGFSEKLVNNNEYRRQVETYLRQIDVGIKRLDISEEIAINKDTGEKEKHKMVRTVHDIYDSNGTIIGEKKFYLHQESSGTLRFLAYIQNIIDMMSNGGVFIIDEMSARLHPLMTKLIVDLFCSSNNKKAQLVFTTHDVSLLNNAQFRRDEIVFVEKDDRGASHLFALSDMKVREDASFSKDYLQGKYGAIPVFDYTSIHGPIAKGGIDE